MKYYTELELIEFALDYSIKVLNDLKKGKDITQVREYFETRKKTKP